MNNDNNDSGNTDRHNVNLRNVGFTIQKDNVSKQAGSNRLTIIARSGDWRTGPSTVSMTLRDAKTLRDFLNQNLD